MWSALPVTGITDYDDDSRERAPYVMLDPNQMLRDAQRRGTDLGHFMTELLSGSFPWAKLQQADEKHRSRGGDR